MPYYETVFIGRQELSQSQMDELIEKLAQIVKDNGGTVHKTESWGLRTLAYKIKKNRKGYYGLIETDTEPEALHEMERSMRFNEDILRFLTTRQRKLSEGPSAQMGGNKEDKEAA